MSNRKGKVLTLHERVPVIVLAKTKSARKIAEELGVRKAQIQNILEESKSVVISILIVLTCLSMNKT